MEPIKRSPQLAPLSRDHHNGLLFVWKIRQGLKNETPAGLIAEYIQWFAAGHLKNHFEEEEKFLPPVLPPGDELITQMLGEHALIRELIQKIKHNPDREIISVFADALYDHIRFEERKLFKHIEESLSPPQLDGIHEQLTAHPACDTEWGNEFWIKK